MLSFIKHCLTHKDLVVVPCDASVLCFILGKAFEYCTKSVRLQVGECEIIFESTQTPFIKVVSETHLKGFLFRNSLDGVGRIFLAKDSSDSLHQALKDLCKPCLCRAGHFFLVRLRLGDFLECECGSLLYHLNSTARSIGHCPITKETSIGFPLRQLFALATADQRKRILDGLR